MDKSVIEVILQYGGLGAVLIVVGWAYFNKDSALLKEQQLRIDDAKAYLKLAMTLQESVISAVNKLSEIVDVFEKREAAREVREEAREEALKVIAHNSDRRTR